MLLCERHRPRTTLGVLLSQVELGALRAWLKGEAQAGPARVQAPTGSGITTAVQLLARELDMEALWITPAVAQPKNLLCDAISSPVAVNGRVKVVVLDDFDSLASDLLPELGALAKRAGEGKAVCKVVCLGRRARVPKLDDACRKWPSFKFARVPAKALAARLCEVAALEGIDLAPQQAEHLARTANSDIRSALNSLDLMRRRGDMTLIDMTQPAAAAAVDHTAAVKDDVMDGMDVVELLLEKRVPLAEALRLGSLDASVVPMGLFENFLDESQSVTPDVCEFFSIADVLEKKAYATSSWDLLDVYAALAVAGPVAVMDRRRRPPKKTPADAEAKAPRKFGVVWSKMYNQCTKAKGLRGVQQARAEAGLPPMGVQDLAYVRAIVQSALKAGDDDALRSAVHGLGGANLLAVMRLWKVEYKASTHARVKRLLAAAG